MTKLLAAWFMLGAVGGIIRLLDARVSMAKEIPSLSTLVGTALAVTLAMLIMGPVSLVVALIGHFTDDS